MQAIRTKYFGPSNVRGSRVKATAQAGSVMLEWNSTLNAEQNHGAAAMSLAMRQGWNYGPWYGGGLPDGSMAWVCASSQANDSFTVPTKKE